MDPFLLLPALSRAKPEFLMSMRKGRQSPKTAILPNRPAGRTRRGPGNHTTAFEKACSLQIRRTVGHPCLHFWWKRNPISISESVFLPLPSSSLSFHGWGKHFLIWTWRAFFTSLIQTKRGVNIGRLKDDFQVLATPCVQYKIWKAAGMTKGGFLSCTEKLRGIIDRMYSLSSPYFFWYHRYISISQIEKERADGSYPLYRTLNPIYWSKDLRQIPDFAFSFF